MRHTVAVGVLALLCWFAGSGCTRISPGTAGTAASAKQESTQQEIETPRPLAAYQVEWGARQVPKEMEVGKTYTGSVTSKNTSNDTWPARGDGPRHINRVSVAYHWLAKEGTGRLKEPETRNPLPHDIGPGESCTVSVRVIAPSKPGSYRLQITLVQELVTWFEQKGAATLTLPVTVR
jgi:hypothetical protein